MIKTNKLMSMITKNKIENNSNIDIIIDDIINNTLYINDCVIYSKENIDNKIPSFYEDKTSYEVSLNELIYEKKILNPSLYSLLGEKLKKALYEKYHYNFVIYIIEEELNDFFQIRFHIDRTSIGESLWFNGDIEKYNERVMIVY